MAEVLKVFVGCLEAQWLPFAVLRHSILKRASRPVAVLPLYETGIEIPVPRNEQHRQKTPFSFQRFTVPQACGYRGKAIYLDSDMLVFDDICELFDRDFGDANVLAVPSETSVLVLDCGRLAWNIRDLVGALDAGALGYDALMKCRAIAKVADCLPGRWNWLDNSSSKSPSNVALLHYTVTTSQPWLSSGHSFGHLWLQELFDALDAGTITPNDVTNAVECGFVRPSLRYQVDRRVTRKVDIPTEVRAADNPFAEYCRSVKHQIVAGYNPS